MSARFWNCKSDVPVAPVIWLRRRDLPHDTGPGALETQIVAISDLGFNFYCADYMSFIAWSDEQKIIRLEYGLTRAEGSWRPLTVEE